MSQRIISVAIEKGGIGKTTTIVNLACLFAMDKKKVLVIDCDPQANATLTLTDKNKNDWAKVGLFDLFRAFGIPGADIHNYIHNTKYNHVDIIPSTLHTKQILSLFKVMSEENPTIPVYHYLSLIIEPVLSEYDYILIDTPPSQDELTVSALFASSDVVIPITADKYSQAGMINTVSLLEDVKRKESKNINLLGILFVRSKRTVLQEIARESMQNSDFAQVLFSSEIREGQAVVDSNYSNEAVVVASPKSNPAKDYFSFFEELKKRL